MLFVCTNTRFLFCGRLFTTISFGRHIHTVNVWIVRRLVRLLLLCVFFLCRCRLLLLFLLNAVRGKHYSLILPLSSAQFLLLLVFRCRLIFCQYETCLKISMWYENSFVSFTLNGVGAIRLIFFSFFSLSFTHWGIPLLLYILFTPQLIRRTVERVYVCVLSFCRSVQLLFSPVLSMCGVYWCEPNLHNLGYL